MDCASGCLPLTNGADPPVDKGKYDVGPLTVIGRYVEIVGKEGALGEEVKLMPPTVNKPLTVNFDVGVFVPIPTLPLSSIVNCSVLSEVRKEVLFVPVLVKKKMPSSPPSNSISAGSPTRMSP